MTDALLEIDHLRQWIGRAGTAEDTVSARLVAGYLVVLDDLKPDLEVGEAAPLAIHGCLAPAARPLSQLGLDGYPERGGLLPPVPLPHWMWAGGQIDLCGRFFVVDVVTRNSTVREVVLKSGRSGALCFVTVDHAFTGPQGLVLTERHDIVYRAPRNPDAPAPLIPQSPKARWSYSVMANPVLLFRYSAITFNGHRIHYDRDHAIKAEGYAGLVGPRPSASHDDAGIRRPSARHSTPELRLSRHQPADRRRSFHGERSGNVGRPASVDCGL